MRRTYGGVESGIGAVYEWSGNLKAGSGRMEIVDTVDAERVVIDLRFLKPFRSRGTATFALQESGDGTVVTWSMDRVVGPAFEKGLTRLKADAEGGVTYSKPHSP
jgi:carbon monoxide dehydrogenase subunit G